MGKKSKVVTLEDGAEPEKSKHIEDDDQVIKNKSKKIKGKSSEGLNVEQENNAKKIKKQTKRQKEESITPSETSEGLNDEVSKKKKRKKEKEESRISSEMCEVKEEINNGVSKKKKRKKDKEESKEASENKEELTDEAPKSKSRKKEKEKRDKSLDTFNDLKKVVDDDDIEDEPDGEEGEKKSKKKSKKNTNVDHVHETKGHSRALRYLDNWNDAVSGKKDSGWKFEKCRQNWLVAHAYDKDRIPDSKFDVLLKYLNSIKGKMRGEVLGTAKRKIELEEKWLAASTSEKTEKEEMPVETRPAEKEVERAKEIVLMLEDN